jgi:hypothetical protein
LSKSLAAAVLVAAALVLPVLAQTPGRVATTIEAALADPVFFHGRQVAIRAAVAEDRSLTRVVVGGAAAATAGPPKFHPVFVFWRQQPTRSDGEIRGEFYDLGRLREDDSRFANYDLRPILEVASGGHWPNRDEVFVIVGATLTDAPEPTTPSLRAIVMSPQKFEGRGVTVTGRFRGRNLFGDLAEPLNRSRYDFVLQSADAAIWIGNLRPRGNGFELDPGVKLDTGKWLEVSGTVHVEGNKVWVEGESLHLSKPPSDSEPEPAPTPVIKEPPPAVIFTAPLADDTDVATTTTVRVQFSRDMDGKTFRGHVRASYVTTNPAAPPPEQTPPITAAYRDGTRALELKFAQPLERFQTVKIELLEGITANDGQPLAPWSMTFSLGAK